MGLYVLLEFDDTDAGKKFMETMREAKAAEDPQGFEDYAISMAACTEQASLLGVFAKPTVLCECTSSSDKSFMGRKMGWWICPQCRRPKARSGQNLRNLLDKEVANTTRTGILSVHVQWVRDEDGRVRTQVVDPWRRH